MYTFVTKKKPLLKALILCDVFSEAFCSDITDCVLGEKYTHSVQCIQLFVLAHNLFKKLLSEVSLLKISLPKNPRKHDKVFKLP